MSVRQLSIPAGGVQSGFTWTERRDFYLDPSFTAELWEDVTPFLTLMSRKPARTVPDPDFKMFEHRAGWLDMTFLVNDATPPAWTGTSAGDTISGVTVDTPEGFGLDGIGDHLIGATVGIYDTTGGTWKGVAQVTAVTGNDLDLVFLGSPSGASNALADNDIFKVMGSAFGEGSTSPEAYSDDLEIVWNSCQIHRTPLEVTGTMYHQNRLRGYPSEIARLRSDKSKEHQLKIEHTLLFGVRPGGTNMDGAGNFATILTDANGKNKRFTQGMWSIVEQYGATTGDHQNKFLNIDPATFDYDTWVDYTEKVFRNLPTNGQKIAFAGGAWMSFFAKIGANGFMGNSGVAPQISNPYYDGRLGFFVRELYTPHGVVLLRDLPIFRGTLHNKKMIIVDEANVEKVMYRPDMFHQNIKTENGYDGQKDEYFSDMGLAVTMQEAHSIWTLQ